jgi:hypothetical protein
MTNYVGKVVMHTTKAIKRGCYADRAYFVVAQDGRWLIAWKVDQDGDGLWEHPGVKGKFATLSKLSRHKGAFFNGRVAWGSDPTASFKMDSLYQVVKVK